MSIFSKKKTWNDYMNLSRATNIFHVDDRVKQKLTFLGIHQDTLNQVKEAADILSPYKDEIVDHFYENIHTVQHLNKLILEHSTFDRLKTTMKKYLEQFLHAEINQNYVNTRVVIGHVHSRINLTAEHFISAHHVLIHFMTSILMEKLRHTPHQMMEKIVAVQKLAAFDQQLIVEVYMEQTFKTFLFGISDLLNHTTQLDTSKQLIASMDKQMEESHSLRTATEQMSASIHEVANYASKVAESTDQAVKSAEQSKIMIDDALSSINQVGKVYDQVVDQVKELEHQIDHTQEVVHMIREIANQTNILALNAAIEASRAGAHGKGFSVVANEIRTLAEHTKAQIQQITSNMDALHQVSGHVIEQINQTGHVVEKSVSEAQQAREVISVMVDSMMEINRSTSQIAAMTEEQSAVVTDMTERISIIHQHSTHTQKIAKETAKTIYDISSKMDQYRNTFFHINIHFNEKDLVKIAISDHLLWKWNIYNMLLGVQSMDINQVTSHKNCRLGQWYYGELPLSIKESAIFKQLEQPHKDVHYHGKTAIELYENGNLPDAEHALKLLEQASEKVIHLLSNLETTL